MDGKEIADGQQFFQGIDGLDAEFGGLLGGEEWVGADDLQVQPDGPPRDLTTDAPQSDDAERLAGELRADELGSFPFFCVQALVGCRDVAG